MPVKKADDKPITREPLTSKPQLPIPEQVLEYWLTKLGRATTTAAIATGDIQEAGQNVINAIRAVITKGNKRIEELEIEIKKLGNMENKANKDI